MALKPRQHKQSRQGEASINSAFRGIADHFTLWVLNELATTVLVVVIWLAVVDFAGFTTRGKSQAGKSLKCADREHEEFITQPQIPSE